MQTESLARAYELTKTMAVAIETGDWQFASDLAEERSPLLMSLSAAQTEEALATIRAIQQMDEQIMQQSVAAREAVADAHAEAQKRISAANFYQSTDQLR